MCANTNNRSGRQWPLRVVIGPWQDYQISSRIRRRSGRKFVGSGLAEFERHAIGFTDRINFCF
jgi:hypothetical protein